MRELPARPLLIGWRIMAGRSRSSSSRRRCAPAATSSISGAGFDIAERMGLLPQLQQQGYVVKEVRAVNRKGRKIAGLSVDLFTQATQGRYTSIPRGDLAAIIFAEIAGKVETIFGDSVNSVEQTDHSVRVTLERGAVREFDLLIGADGLHSRIRQLVFGPENQFEKYMGYKVAAFAVEGYRPRDELVYMTYTEVGQQVGRFSMRGDRTMFLFVFADKQMDGASGRDARAQKALLRTRFGNSGWECPRILDALDASDELYFDRVSQIRMNSDAGLWTRGRVALVGDAASCISLLGGQGSALAMIAAYILAGELHRSKGDYSRAFTRYQELFGPFVAKKQKAAMRFGSALCAEVEAGIVHTQQNRERDGDSFRRESGIWPPVHGQDRAARILKNPRDIPAVQALRRRLRDQSHEGNPNNRRARRLGHGGIRVGDIDTTAGREQLAADGDLAGRAGCHGTHWTEGHREIRVPNTLVIRKVSTRQHVDNIRQRKRCAREPRDAGRIRDPSHK